jgi:ABC-2 type transport system ATP-binding protein
LAFVRPFQVLLVDEPFVGLDLTGRDALLALFDQATADGATVVVATHDLSFLERVDRVIVLRDGELAFDGTADEADVETLLREEH